MSDGCITSIWEGNSAWLQPNFCSSLYTSDLVKPRGLHIDNDEILLVEWGRSRVVRLDNDGTNVVPVATIEGLNHGIELAGSYLYASTPTAVYRWPYQTGQMTAGDDDDAQEVIVGMEKTAGDELGAQGGHLTRTLAFDPEGRWLYVSIGSLGNVDVDSFRARIRRFDIAAWDAIQPFNYNDGEVFADGLRNEVGLSFDSHGDLWGVENGADRLYRDDLGGDIHNDNPSEELNRFREDQAGETWGYPYCWSEYCLPIENGGSGIKGANTAWAWPSFISSGYTDEWCRENTNPSAMSMPAHSAPLGITFYSWRDVSQEECAGGFPKSMDKYAFMAFHGSWNRSPATGYKIVFVPFDSEGNPTALPIDLFRHGGDGAAWPDPVRPVDVQFDSCGRLFVTEDGTGSVIKITYGGGYADEFEPIEKDVADGASCSAGLIISPSLKPTANPTKESTPMPSSSPLARPTASPSSSPRNSPTNLPTLPPVLPPSSSPSKNPTVSTLLPSQKPLGTALVPELPTPIVPSEQNSNSPSDSQMVKTNVPSSTNYWTLKPEPSNSGGSTFKSSLFSHWIGRIVFACAFVSSILLLR
mmetsp:Transcript_3144/g.6939  ORF Transcript_3144/g.6939 Transcript_3144/m.6939 type:complete len:585 (-) Transcript_3144:1307-3061(-)